MRVPAQRRHLPTWALLCLLALLARGAELRAADDYISPEQVVVSTPPYRASFAHFAPRLGTYTYAGTWKGIPAVDIGITVGQDERHYHVVVVVRTAKWMDFFYKLEYRADALISSFDLLPVTASVEHRENESLRTTRLDFTDAGEIVSVRSQAKSPDKVLRFKPGNFTLDPFSAAFLSRSLDWQVGDTNSFDVFTGKYRYRVDLSAVERASLPFAGVPRDVWVVSPKIDNLTSGKKNKKFREAKLYVTADDARDVLEIVTEVFVGNITVRQVSFTPSGQPVPAVRVPRQRRP